MKKKGNSIPHKIDYNLLSKKDKYIVYQYVFGQGIDLKYIPHYNQGRMKDYVNNVIIIDNNRIVLVIHNIKVETLHFHYDNIVFDGKKYILDHDDERRYEDLSDNDKKIVEKVLKYYKKKY